MSEHITHIAVADDSFRLVQSLDGIAQPIREALDQHRDFARLGAITRKGDRFTVDLLDTFRESDDPSLTHLAFVLGWLTHRAADREMKPVFRRLRVGDEKPSECSVYNDVFLLRTVYLAESDPTFHARLLEGDEQTRIDAARELFQLLLQGTLIELHTFIPDESDITGWLDRLFAARQTMRVDLDRYIAAFTRPDPAKVRRYLEEPNFYDPREPVIATARSIQRGESIAPQAVADSISHPAQSHYARILQLSLAYLQAASDFLQGTIDRADLEEALKIGLPGVDGGVV